MRGPSPKDSGKERAAVIAAVLGLVFAAPGASTAFAAGDGQIVFNRDIRPIFADHCVKCHGPEKQKGGLRLDLKEHAMKGGDDGKVIEPGRSGDSKLIHFVEGREADKI